MTPGAAGRSGCRGSSASARAKELILTGRVLTATRPSAIGLVNRVVPAGGAVAPRPTSSATEIAARGPLAVREAKRLIDTALDRDIEAGLAAEFEASERIFATEDMVEGARAFFEKRDPDYHGR